MCAISFSVILQFLQNLGKALLKVQFFNFILNCFVQGTI